MGATFIVGFTLLYGCSLIGVEFIHSVFHAESVHHLAEDENDPCHRAIYHADIEHGCGHNTHLSEDSGCDFCNIQFFRDDQIIANTSFELHNPSTHFARLDQPRLLISSITIREARGPPQG